MCVCVSVCEYVRVCVCVCELSIFVTVYGISLRSCSYTIKISELHVEFRNHKLLQFGCVFYNYKKCAKKLVIYTNFRFHSNLPTQATN